jgi:catechol 2,3-dioxygenase-like lactoylglutathione lyase family enzyme
MSYRMSGIVLGTPDPRKLAAFYQRMLGWEKTADEPGWVMLKAPHDGTGLSFQEEDAHVRPVWPSRPGDQQMQVHLDIAVDDLDEATTHAVDSGATTAEFQPQPHVRVMLDPDGHPFCLFVG